jgi:hypothetical protein
MPRYYDAIDLVDRSGNVTARLTPQHGNLVLGGSGQDGDLSTLNAAGRLTIHLNGEHGAITLGGAAQDGDLSLRNAGNVQTIHLNGQSGTLHLGAEGQDGDLFLYDGSGRNTLHLNGQSGNVRVRGQALDVPDYVFEPGYPLPSLDSVRAHVTARRYLPDVPSRAEIEEEGVDLAELSMALLRKIEELTLHVIRQEERLAALESR